MKDRSISLMLIVATLCLSAAVEHALAQSAQSFDTPQSEAVLIKLFVPPYPPLAQAAEIAGDVDLMLAIRRDGSVESAVVVSGHPMLKQAALDSARRSQFKCVGCGDAVTSYPLKYKFQITPRDPQIACDMRQAEKQLPSEVDLSRHQVTVSAWQKWTCDPAVHKIRSAKCLYLWRCGTRDLD